MRTNSFDTARALQEIKSWYIRRKREYIRQATSLGVTTLLAWAFTTLTVYLARHSVDIFAEAFFVSLLTAVAVMAWLSLKILETERERSEDF
jgi:hypothetical protein